MKFDISQDLSLNALVVYVNSQCILAGEKPQKNFFVLHLVLILNLNNVILGHAA